MYLVDASIWLHALRRDGDPFIQAALKPLILTGNVAIADLSLIELIFNLRPSPMVESFLKQFAGIPRLEILSWQWPEALQLAAKARMGGASISPVRFLVAITAMKNYVQLMHCNQSYEAIKAFVPLSTLDLSHRIPAVENQVCSEEGRGK